MAAPSRLIGNVGYEAASVERSKRILYAAAVFSLTAALIHLWVMPQHFEEWWGYGAFMLASALCQGLYSVVLLRMPAKPVLLAGIAGNLAILTLYTLTRTVAIPLGPHAGHAESVGGFDYVSAAAEVALVMALAVLLQNLYRMKVVLPATFALVVALAAVGVYFSVGLIQGGTAAGLEKEQDGSFAMAQDIPTSFGVVAVEYAQKLNGLKAKQLAGATHGIQNLVPPDKVQVQTFVTLSNQLGHPVKYSPDQFSLISEKSKKPIPVFSGNIQSGTLQPDAGVEATLSFVAPRDGSKLWIQYEDLNHEKILIDLGRTDKTPAGALDGYHHH